jgi:hypothetical protein
MAIATQVIEKRPNTVEFAFGRAWYAVDQTVYFSQLMEHGTIDALNRCYSQNDPTSGELSDPLATDGGFIVIDDAAEIQKLKKFRNGVLVFDKKGVWYIAGSSDTGFSATSYVLMKLDDVECASPESVVSAEGSVFFWGMDAIYAIGVNESGQIVVQDISSSTIHTEYIGIDGEIKRRSFGVYNEARKEIEWLYGESANQNISGAFTRALVYSLKTGGFFKHKYEGATKMPTGAYNYAVVGAVKTLKTDEVGATTYLVVEDLTPSNQTAHAIRLTHKDSQSFDDFGTTYEAYIETAPETLGKPSNKKRSPYIVAHFKKTETGFSSNGGALDLDNKSSCLMTAKWDWNTTASGGRWSPQQELYRFSGSYIPTGAGDTFDTGESIITTKTKIIGRGRSMKMRLESPAGKDAQILGWTIQWAMKGRL